MSTSSPNCCLICSTTSNCSRPSDKTKISRAIKQIFKYLIIPSRNHLPIISSSNSFCPNCLIIVEEIVNLEDQIELIELKIKDKVETIGKVIIETTPVQNLISSQFGFGIAGSSRKPQNSSEVWVKFKKPVVQNYMEALLPNPSVRLGNQHPLQKLKPNFRRTKKKFLGPRPGPACSKPKQQEQVVCKVEAAPIASTSSSTAYRNRPGPSCYKRKLSERNGLSKPNSVEVGQNEDSSESTSSVENPEIRDPSEDEEEPFPDIMVTKTVSLKVTTDEKDQNGSGTSTSDIDHPMEAVECSINEMNVEPGNHRIDLNQFYFTEDNISMSCRFCGLSVNSEDCKEEGETLESILMSHVNTAHYEDVIPSSQESLQKSNAERASDPLNTSSSVIVEDHMKCPACDYIVPMDISGIIPGWKLRGLTKSKLSKHFAKTHGGKLPSSLEARMEVIDGNHCFQCPQCDRVQTVKYIKGRSRLQCQDFARRGLLVHIRLKHQKAHSSFNRSSKEESPQLLSPDHIMLREINKRKRSSTSPTNAPTSSTNAAAARDSSLRSVRSPSPKKLMKDMHYYVRSKASSSSQGINDDELESELDNSAGPISKPNILVKKQRTTIAGPNKFSCPAPNCDFSVQVIYDPGADRWKCRARGKNVLAQHYSKTHGSTLPKAINVAMSVVKGKDSYQCPICKFFVSVRYTEDRSAEKSQSNAHSGLIRHCYKKHPQLLSYGGGTIAIKRGRRRKVAPEAPPISLPEVVADAPDFEQKCPVCDGMFEDEVLLNQHIRLEHYFCHTCGESASEFMSYEALLSHQYAHLDDNQKDEANEEGKDLPQNVRETLITEGRDPQMFEFSNPLLAEAEIMKRVEATAQDMTEMSVISELNQYDITKRGDLICRTCGVCKEKNNLGPNRKDMMLHIKQHHLKRLLICSVCGIRFRTQAMIEGHHALRHLSS